jgi:hypothetical protein
MISKYLKITLCLVFSLPVILFSQSLKKLNGINSQLIYSAAMDTSNNVYCIHSNSSDTSIVYRYNALSGQWNFYSVIIENQLNNNNLSTLQWFNQGLIATGFSDIGIVRTKIYRIVSNNFTQIGNLTYLPGKLGQFPLQSVKVDNKLYYFGPIDTMFNLARPVIVEYDGNTANKITPPTYNDNSKIYALNDSLMVVTNNVIYSYYNGNWNTHYRHPSSSNIYSFASDGKTEYISDAQGKLVKLLNGQVFDSSFSGVNKPLLIGMPNIVYFTSRDGFSGNVPFYTYNSQNQIQFNFRSMNEDSLGYKSITDGKRLFIYNTTNLNVEGQNFGPMAEVNHSNLVAPHLDTIYIRSYRDENRNGNFDINEKSVMVIMLDGISGRVLLLDSNQVKSFLVYDTEPVSLSVNYILYGSKCYHVDFDGGISSKAYNNPLQVDTINIPLTHVPENIGNYNVYATAHSEARLNENQKVLIELRNPKCNILSKNLTVKVKLHPDVQLINSVPNFSSRNGNVLEYDLNAGSGVNDILLTINYPNTKFSLNQIIQHYVELFPIGGDTKASDNVDTVRQKMVYSYDPNIKNCYPNGLIKQDLKKIRYKIEFQNEGNADAWRVRVVDTLNMNIPVYSYKMIGTSHPCQISHQDNIITWTFNNIYLKPKSVSEAGSRGYLEFEANINSGLRVGDSIINSAAIFFDYNEPIITNDCKVKRVEEDTVSINNPIYFNNHLKIYPNPLSNEEHLHLVNMGYEHQTVYLYNAHGQLMGEYTIGAKDTLLISMKDMSTGIYLITGKHGGSYKLIKE